MSKKVYKLKNSARVDLKLQNECRVKFGLKPLVIKMRKCITCSQMFESIEKRRCPPCCRHSSDSDHSYIVEMGH